LKPAEGAKVLDNSALTVDECVKAVLDWWEASRDWPAVSSS
jgi:3-phosphoshikimate 1-carboxyvinyltransferase